MATKAAALSWRLDQRPSDRAFATTHARDPRPAPRAGHRCLLRRRVPGRPEPAAGDRAVLGGRAALLARAPLLRLRRGVLRRPARAGGLQCPAGHLRPGHVVAPVRPAGQPGAVHGEPRPPVHHQRPRLEHLRPRAELRLLHREHAPGLAEARRAPLDEDEGRGARGRGLGAEPGRLRLPRRPRRRRGRHRLPVPRDARDHGPPRAARALPAPPAGAGVGGGRDGEPRRRRRAADAGGFAPPPRAGVGRRDGAGRSLSHAAEGHDPLQRSGRGRARPPRLLAGDRGGVDTDPRGRAPPGAAARRLRGAAHDSLELRPGARPRAARGVAPLRGAARGRAPVLAGGRGDERHGEGEAPAPVDARARLGGRDLARRPRVGPRRPAGAGRPRRRGPAHPLRLHEHPHHGVPAARTAEAPYRDERRAGRPQTSPPSSRRGPPLGQAWSPPPGRPRCYQTPTSGSITV